MTPVTEKQPHREAMKAASTIALLAGIWFFISPWIYGSYTLANSWNSWIVGAVITILAAIRLGSSELQATQWMSWINCLLGIWAFVSPWIYQYTGSTGRFVNSLCVGVIVFAAAISSAMATPHSTRPMVTHS